MTDRNYLVETIAQFRAAAMRPRMSMANPAEKKADALQRILDAYDRMDIYQRVADALGPDEMFDLDNPAPSQVQPRKISKHFGLGMPYGSLADELNEGFKGGRPGPYVEKVKHRGGDSLSSPRVIVDFKHQQDAQIAANLIAGGALDQMIAEQRRTAAEECLKRRGTVRAGFKVAMTEEGLKRWARAGGPLANSVEASEAIPTDGFIPQEEMDRRSEEALRRHPPLGPSTQEVINLREAFRRAYPGMVEVWESVKVALEKSLDK